MEERIRRIQVLLKREGLDGWLFAGYRNPDPVLAAALRVVAPVHTTRRYVYFVPASGEPIKLLHSIERNLLAELPGATWIYHNRFQWEQAIAGLLEGHSHIALQYSPRGALPSVDTLPGGWLELLREHGAQPVSSASLLAEMATLTPQEITAHEATAKTLTTALQEAFAFIKDAAGQGKEITELKVQATLSQSIRDAGLDLPDPPIVAFGEHTADPHYAPEEETNAVLQREELVLIDIWARSPGPDAVYADLTWMGVHEEEIPHEFEQLFAILCRARDQGFALVERSAKEKRPLPGAHVDELVRGFLEAEGYQDYFIHRTGHSLGQDVHGIGVNLDSVETYDERPLLPGSAFTIEPGAYLPGRYGMRTEINVVFLDGEARITTQPFQKNLLAILA